MNVHTYKTSGGKDLIRNYLDSLPKHVSAEGYHIIELLLEIRGLDALDILNTRQLDHKIWEIKFYRHNRIMYLLLNQEKNIYLLHACKKQKGKAEKFELNTARKRAKEII